MSIFNLFVKKKKPALERIYIPKEYLEKFYELWDIHIMEPSDHIKSARYNLWKLVEEALDRDLSNEIWKIKGGTNIMKPYIERIEDE